MHGADSDIVWLQRDFGIYVLNLFDTGRASRVLQLRAHGLAHLLETFCGVKANKAYQLADWRQRPLPADMLEYARMDTQFLLSIFDKIHALLAERPGALDEARCPRIHSISNLFGFAVACCVVRSFCWLREAVVSEGMAFCDVVCV